MLYVLVRNGCPNIILFYFILICNVAACSLFLSQQNFSVLIDFCRVQVLQAIKNLLQLKSVDVSIFKDYCRLDMALEGLRQQLQKMLEQNDREFVLEVENLRREVEFIYQSRLDNTMQQQVMQVPT